jgi:hypothetical protein
MHKNMDLKFSSLHENRISFCFCFSDLEAVASSIYVDMFIEDVVCARKSSY